MAKADSIVPEQPFGSLTTVEYLGKRNGKGPPIWRCRCACGRETQSTSYNLLKGYSQSCGCSRDRGTHRTHGLSNSVEYGVWCGMINRCRNKTHRSYPNYGGRGIKVCKRWQDSFLAFLADMGPRPSSRHSIDRHPNNNGNYEPGNCRWATRSQQAANTRPRRPDVKRRDNHLATYRGKTQSTRAWANELGINYRTLLTRLRLGWSIHRAFTAPIRPGHVKPPSS